MKAKLEYVVDSLRVPLETMDFEELDEFTYKTFGTEEDIINSDLYKERLGNLPKTGRVVVSYNPGDVPVRELDKYAKLGGNPMADVECVRVLVQAEEFAPSLRGVRRRMAKFINSPEVAEEFYRFFGDEYTPLERLDHLVGMAASNSELVSHGIKRVMTEYTSGYEGYFMGRAFIERLSNFGSIKQDEKITDTPMTFEKK